MNKKLTKFRWLVTILAGIFLFTLWFSNISGSQIKGDSSTNLRIAFNLTRNGVISDDYEPPYQPTMNREPVSVLVMAMAIGIVDLVVGPAEQVMYFSGNRAKYLKYQNIVWLTLLSLTAFWSIKFFTSSYFVALLGAVLVNLKLPGIASGPTALGIDGLLTELPAAAVLMLSSTLLAIAVHRKKTFSFVLAGLLFGLLALIKAAFLYIFVGIVLVMSARATYAWHKSRTWNEMMQVSVLCLIFGIVVFPWMLRNYNAFESFAISDRGGSVLTIRATLNEMTAGEFRGAIYHWAPNRLQPALGLALGFSPSDLERGGRLQRLNRARTSSFAKNDLDAQQAGRPEMAISYYRKAKADITKHRMEFEAQGHPHPREEAARVLQDRSLRSILEHPGKHLAMTLLVMWRGAPIAFPVLLIAFIIALMNKRESLAVFLLPAFGMAAFYALLTHFLPRYSVPIAPISVTSIVILGYFVFRSRRNLSSTA